MRSALLAAAVLALAFAGASADELSKAEQDIRDSVAASRCPGHPEKPALSAAYEPGALFFEVVKTGGWLNKGIRIRGAGADVALIELGKMEFGPARRFLAVLESRRAEAARQGRRIAVDYDALRLYNGGLLCHGFELEQSREFAAILAPVP